MAIPSATITKNIALSPDNWRRTAYPSGSVPATGTGFTGTDGEIITLSGTGFGDIVNPKPTARDNFNGYGLADGQEIPQGGATDKWAGDLPVGNDGYVLDSSVTLGSRGFSAKSMSRKSQLKGARQYSGAPARSVTSYYGTFWFRHNESLKAQPETVTNAAHKLMRVWDDPGQAMTKVTLETRKNWCNSESAAGKWCDTDPASTGICTVNDRYIYTSGSTAWEATNVWLKLELAIYDNSTAEFFLNGKTLGLMPHFKKSQDAIDGAITWFTEVIGTDIGSSAHLNTTFRQWLAEFIEYSSPARVELRNAASRDVTVEQVRYTQYLNSWADTKITLEAFYGDLDTAAPIYADIIKANGTVINFGQIN